MMLLLLPDYKEQLVDSYGVSILLNIKNLEVQAVFYCLYEGVPLFKNSKKTSRLTTFCFKIDIIYLEIIAPTFNY